MYYLLDICSLIIDSLEQDDLFVSHIGPKSSDLDMSTRLPWTKIEEIVW